MEPTRPILRSGPLTVALRALAPAGVDEPPPLGPFRLLPRLLDLSGSVTLAGALSSPLVHPTPAELGGEDLVAELDAKLDEMERRLAPVFRGELPVSSAVRMRRELKNPGPSMDGGHPGVRAIRAPFSRYVHGNVFDVRTALATFRLDLAPRIAALGDRAARLEGLDAALSDATSRHIEVLVVRLLARLDAAFAEDAKEALLALPRQFDVEHLEPWFAPSGWVPHYLTKVGDVIAALYHQEVSLLRALVRSASGSDTSRSHAAPEARTAASRRTS